MSQNGEQNGLEEQEGFNPETDEILACIPLDDGTDVQQSILDQIDNNSDNAVDEQMEDNAESVQDDSIGHLEEHNGSVFAVHVHENLLATGSEDDRALLWDLGSGEVILECNGHMDSVTMVRFNSKGTLLATGDMSGRVQVWDVVSRSLKSQLSEASDLEWLCWHPSADIVIVGAGDGLIWIWLVPNGNVKVLSGHGVACTAGVLLPDGRHLIAGYADGALKIWDLKEQTAVPIQSVTELTSPVTCVDCHRSQPMAVSGFEDGTVALFHTEQHKVTTLLNLAPVDPSEEANSVESVVFAESVPWLAVGGVQGRLSLFDLNSMLLRHECDHPAGVVKSQWLDSNRIITAALDGVLRLWDARDGTCSAQWSGHTAEILDFSVLSQGNGIVTGSADNSCRIFALE